MADTWLVCVVEGRKFESTAFVDGRYHLTSPGADSSHDRETGIPYSLAGGVWLPDLDVVDLDELEAEE